MIEVWKVKEVATYPCRWKVYSDWACYPESNDLQYFFREKKDALKDAKRRNEKHEVNQPCIVCGEHHYMAPCHNSSLYRGV